MIQISYTDGTPTVSYQYNAYGQRCWMYQGMASTNPAAPHRPVPPPTATTGRTTHVGDERSRRNGHLRL